MTVKERFKQYLDRFSRTYRITPEEAEQHAIVEEVKEYYEEEQTVIHHGNRSI